MEVVWVLKLELRLFPVVVTNLTTAAVTQVEVAGGMSLTRPLYVPLGCQARRN